MKKVEIKHLDEAPAYFYDGSVLYKRTKENESSNEELIKTEFTIPEIRKLDQGEYIIKSEMTTAPLSIRKLFIKYPIPTTSVYTIIYRISEEKIKGIKIKLLHGELFKEEWEKAPLKKKSQKSAHIKADF